MFDPWDWAGVLYLLGGVYAIVLGGVLTVLVWLLFGHGMIAAWRDWRQFRPPAVVIDAAGVRYLAAHRSVLVPWADVEQVGLRRTVFRSRVVAKVFLRLAPGAGLRWTGRFRCPLPGP